MGVVCFLRDVIQVLVINYLSSINGQLKCLIVVDTHIGEALCQSSNSLFLYLVCKCVYYADFMTLNSVFLAEDCIVLHAKGKTSLSVQYLSLVFFKSGFFLYYFCRIKSFPILFRIYTIRK